MKNEGEMNSPKLETDQASVSKPGALDLVESLGETIRDLNRQLGESQARLRSYESRKVPLTEDELLDIFRENSSERVAAAALRLARTVLVAAESPAAVEAALIAWHSPAHKTRDETIAAAIRAAHDEAIDGGCGAARESAGPPWLADAAEALGKKGAALNWSQVIGEIRELVWQRDGFRKEADDLRRQLDALTRPIDGVEELGRIGWEAWIGVQGAVRDEDKIHADERCAQAIASRVIGALRSALLATNEHAKGCCVSSFDAAVASLKIEPAKVDATPKREPFELPHYGLSFGVDDCVAIRDRIREIERRLEAGGL